MVSAWLYKVRAKPQAKPVRGNSELRLTLHYLLTVWCGEEVRVHAALHSLFLAALTAPALSEGLQLTHVPEPPPDAFWLALKVPPRPSLLLTADLVLPRPPTRSAPLVREVLSRVAPSGPQRRSERDGKPGVQWDLLNAWVSEWRGAPLDTLGRDAAIESMTLVFESLERS